jgi:endoglucanase
MLDRGINLGNTLDARRGSRAQPWPGAAGLASAGFRTVRVPVCWTDHADRAGTIEPAFFKRVEAVVDEVLDSGLEAVVNVHHFDAVHADPLGHTELLTHLWRQIAARFADRPAALAFELLNEPRPPMTSNAWNDLAAVALSAVREVDRDRRVIIGPAAANTLDALDDLQLPDDDRIVLTFHYYAPFRFTHQGAWWEPGSDAWLGTRWGSDHDHAVVSADLTRAAAWGREHGRPVFLGEFGAHCNAHRPSRLAWTEWVRREAERLGIGWCYWALATEFGALRPDLHEWDEQLLSALIEYATRPLQHLRAAPFEPP